MDEFDCYDQFNGFSLPEDQADVFFDEDDEGIADEEPERPRCQW